MNGLAWLFLGEKGIKWGSGIISVLQSIQIMDRTPIGRKGWRIDAMMNFWQISLIIILLPLKIKLATIIYHFTSNKIRNTEFFKKFWIRPNTVDWLSYTKKDRIKLEFILNIAGVLTKINCIVYYCTWH